MAKKPSKQEAAQSKTVAGNIVNVTVAYWAAPGRQVTWSDTSGKSITSQKAILRIRDATGYTARELAGMWQVSKRTVSGWLLGRPVAVAAALRVQQWQTENPFSSLMVEAKKESRPPVGKKLNPAGGKAAKSKKATR